MDFSKVVNDNIYDFKIKADQLVTAATFNNIFLKFVDNDKSLLKVRDKYIVGPKPFKNVPKVTEDASGQVSNANWEYYNKKGYKVWQNINNIPYIDSETLPSNRSQESDIYCFKNDFEKTGDTHLSIADYKTYAKRITLTHDEEDSLWESSFENCNIDKLRKITTDKIKTKLDLHEIQHHKSINQSKEQDLSNHNPVVAEDTLELTIIINADIPRSIRTITDNLYIYCEIKNPFTYTNKVGHANYVSEKYHNTEVTPTAYMIEYSSGIKMIYINIPTTKTYWLPFVTPSNLQYEDGYINFYNLPFNSEIYKSQFVERNYFGIGDKTLFGCDDDRHFRKKYTDVSDGCFVTDFILHLDNLKIDSIYSVNMSNESPALKRILFGYSQNSTGKFLKLHGGDNSYYPPSLLVEEPKCDNGNIQIHGCCFGSDSLNIMIICK